MVQNPYKAPESGIEPAMRHPQPIGAAAKRGAWIGAIMLGVSAIPVALDILVGAMPRQEVMYLTLVGVLIGSLAGSPAGAAFGALFQAITNVAIRRASKKTPPAN